VALNAAAGLVVAGLVDDLAGGLEVAVAVLDDGRAALVVERLVAASKAAAESSRV
jgi:anthranilate phosphoribosyltransferase